jgi:ABC-type amino acid transport substrate-binding protein
MIVNKENPGLVTALNALRDQLKANGQLKEILAKYGLTDPAFYPE